MTTTHVFPRPPLPAIADRPRRGAVPGPAAWGVLGVWGGIVLALHASGALATSPGAAPLGLLGALVVPLILFGLALAYSPAVRRFADELDLGLLTAFQSWRIVGATLLVLLIYGRLPGTFAWPAGLGDVAVGLAAPFVAFAVYQGRAGWQARVRWLNLAGLLDFVVAYSSGLAMSETAFGVLRDTEAVSSSLMTSLPLAIVPTFLIPVFVIAHWISLWQLRNRQGAS